MAAQGELKSKVRLLPHNGGPPPRLSVQQKIKIEEGNFYGLIVENKDDCVGILSRFGFFVFKKEDPSKNPAVGFWLEFEKHTKDAPVIKSLVREVVQCQKLKNGTFWVYDYVKRYKDHFFSAFLGAVYDPNHLVPDSFGGANVQYLIQNFNGVFVCYIVKCHGNVFIVNETLPRQFKVKLQEEPLPFHIHAYGDTMISLFGEDQRHKAEELKVGYSKYKDQQQEEFKRTRHFPAQKTEQKDISQFEITLIPSMKVRRSFNEMRPMIEKVMQTQKFISEAQKYAEPTFRRPQRPGQPLHFNQDTNTRSTLPKPESESHHDHQIDENDLSKRFEKLTRPMPPASNQPQPSQTNSNRSSGRFENKENGYPSNNDQFGETQQNNHPSFHRQESQSSSDYKEFSRNPSGHPSQANSNRSSGRVSHHQDRPSNTYNGHQQVSSVKSTTRSFAKLKNARLSSNPLGGTNLPGPAAPQPPRPQTSNTKYFYKQEQEIQQHKSDKTVFISNVGLGAGVQTAINFLETGFNVVVHKCSKNVKTAIERNFHESTQKRLIIKNFDFTDYESVQIVFEQILVDLGNLKRIIHFADCRANPNQELVNEMEHGLVQYLVDQNLTSTRNLFNVINKYSDEHPSLRSCNITIIGNLVPSIDLLYPKSVAHVNDSLNYLTSTFHKCGYPGLHVVDHDNLKFFSHDEDRDISVLDQYCAHLNPQ